jgi:putative ATP-binding cassette transporter
MRNPERVAVSAKAKRARNFDRRLWARFWQIARPYWFSRERWIARGLLALLIVLLIGRTEFNVLFNQQSGEFTSALAARDAHRFWHSMLVFGGALLAGVPIYAFCYYVRDRLGIAWRRWLTHQFLGKYLNNRAYYDLTTNETIDNPDQRIADDINSFSTKSLRFLLELISAAMQLVAFSGILWSISRTLVAILVAYATFGMLVTFGVFGKPLIALNYQQLRREADFRFGLIRIRENAEPIAFYRGEAREGRQVKERFRALYENYKALLQRTLGLNFFQYAFSFIPYALPSVVIASRILSGELEVGRAVQAAGAFTAMLSALTVFVDNFETLSAFAAGIDRLHAFSKTLDAEAQPPPEAIDTREQDALALEQVTLKIPNQDTALVRDLSIAVEQGQSLLIVGASGGGKSSLLRAIAGLWRRGHGTIGRPSLEQMLFLPQRPYMILGTLREQLLYPNVDRDVNDEELTHVLKQVNLPHIIERCSGFDCAQDFGKILSVGEQQRLAIARVLLTNPKYTVLDEATSALDEENEARLYSLLGKLDTTLVSVAHHPGLLKYHSQVLELTGDGGFRVRTADTSESETEHERTRQMTTSEIQSAGSPQCIVHTQCARRA